MTLSNHDFTTTLTTSVNYNKSELDSDASEYLKQEDQGDSENQDPNWRAVVSAMHQWGPFNILGRARYFGCSEDTDGSPAGSIQHFEAMTFFDRERAWQINDNFRVSVGGRNLLDQHPEQVDRSVTATTTAVAVSISQRPSSTGRVVTTTCA